VIAAGRDVCNQVRHAVSQMGLPLDFVTTVDAAREFCQQRLPHAIIYESQAHDRNFDQLRSDIQQQASGLAWIEITEHGEAFEVSSFGGSSMARVGRDAITTSLPSALMFELAKGG
jgi:DNA-binding NtrC family response regulator